MERGGETEVEVGRRLEDEEVEEGGGVVREKEDAEEAFLEPEAGVVLVRE